jgi:predicted deacylase
MQRDTIDLPMLAPGLAPRLSVLRFGQAGSGPKIYIQGGLHADEAPGSLAAHRLAERLATLPEDAITGEVIIVPVANPIGLSQRVLGLHLGRYALDDGRNFNRGYPDVSGAVIAALEGKLSLYEAANTRLLRAALRAAIAARSPVEPVPALKRALLGLAIDADWVLDLHCDAEALPHLYTQPAFVADFEPFTRLMGARAILTAEASGDHPFDEAISAVWEKVRLAFPLHPFARGGIAATVELRGQQDTEPHFAEGDAEAILGFLTHLGVLKGEAPALPEARCEATPLAGCSLIDAPATGALQWHVPLGAVVSEGQVIGDIIDAAEGNSTPVRAECAGLFFARSQNRQVLAGQKLGKIAGREPLRAGQLLGP